MEERVDSAGTPSSRNVRLRRTARMALSGRWRSCFRERMASTTFVFNEEHKILLPKAFPSEAEQRLMGAARALLLGPPKDEDRWREFAGATNNVAWRFRSCVEGWQDYRTTKHCWRRRASRTSTVARPLSFRRSRAPQRVLRAPVTRPRRCSRTRESTISPSTTRFRGSGRHRVRWRSSCGTKGTSSYRRHWRMFAATSSISCSSCGIASHTGRTSRGSFALALVRRSLQAILFSTPRQRAVARSTKPPRPSRRAYRGWERCSRPSWIPAQLSFGPGSLSRDGD